MPKPVPAMEYSQKKYLWLSEGRNGFMKLQLFNNLAARLRAHKIIGGVIIGLFGRACGCWQHLWLAAVSIPADERICLHQNKGSAFSARTRAPCKTG